MQRNEAVRRFNSFRVGVIVTLLPSVADCIGSLLQSNSRQTMEALRDYLANRTAAPVALRSAAGGVR